MKNKHSWESFFGRYRRNHLSFTADYSIDNVKYTFAKNGTGGYDTISFTG